MSGDQFTTCVGVFADSVGICQWEDYSRSVGRDGVMSVTKRTTTSLDPASDYDSYQPDEIPVLWQHRRDAEVGKVVLLDRRQGRLAAVAVLGPHPPGAYDGLEGQLYWSSKTEGPAPFRLVELTLTPEPATSALPPVTFYSGLPSEAKLYGDGRPRDLLRAADEVVSASHGMVQRARCRFDDLDRPSRPGFDSRGAAEPMELFIRPCGPIIAVNGHPPRGLQ